MPTRIQVLLVDDNEAFAGAATTWLAEQPGLDLVGRARTGVEAIRMARDLQPTVVVMDLGLPGMDGFEATRLVKTASPERAVVVLTLNDCPTAREEAMAVGADAFVGKADLLTDLVPAIRRVAGNPAPEEPRTAPGRAPSRTVDPFAEVKGSSDAIARVLRAVAIVAPTDSTVLVEGETGTGKELVARALHRASRRHAGPFVKVNCAAIPASLVESELFGHEKGSFTGAARARIGRFEAADGGTIFLDEIGELSLDMQAKLLHVLQEGEFERVGESRPRRVDVRIVAATNRGLARSVAAGRFRSDLFYRLDVFPIRVPPLRERGGDVPVLAVHMLEEAAARLRRELSRFSDEALQRMARYPWPGNVRELRNVVERSAILADGPIVEVVGLGSEIGPETEVGDAETLEENERRHILRTLERTRWVLEGPRGAAECLGLPASSLRSRMKRLGIARPAAAGPDDGPVDSDAP